MLTPSPLRIPWIHWGWTPAGSDGRGFDGDGDGGDERELFVRFRSFFLSAHVSPSSTLLEASWHP